MTHDQKIACVIRWVGIGVVMALLYHGFWNWRTRAILDNTFLFRSHNRFVDWRNAWFSDNEASQYDRIYAALFASLLVPKNVGHL